MELTGAWSTDLAKLIKQPKDNSIGAMIGEIVSLSPFRVTLWGGELIIRSDIHEVYISNNTITTTNTEGSHSQNYDSFEVGDKVLVIPDRSQQVFFVTDVLKKV